MKRITTKDTKKAQSAQSAQRINPVNFVKDFVFLETNSTSVFGLPSSDKFKTT